MTNNAVKEIFIGAVDRAASAVIECMLGQIPGFVPTGQLTQLRRPHSAERVLLGVAHQLRPVAAGGDPRGLPPPCSARDPSIASGQVPTKDRKC